MTTTLVIPAYNEEEALPLVIEECIDKVDEVVVVDDGSTDGTIDIASKYSVKIVKHEKNLGKVEAIRSGVKNSKGDIVILIDADYTYPAKYIPAFEDEIKNGSDLVIGSRFKGGKNKMPRLNKTGNKIFSFIATYISGVKITDGQSGYRAFKREMFEKLDVEAKSLEFETKMTVKAAKLGYKITEIPIEYRERVGKSKLRPLRDGSKMFKSLIAIAYDETSIIAKGVILPGIIFTPIGFYFGFVSVYQKFTPEGITNAYFPLLGAFFVLMAVQLISMGLLIDHLIKKTDRINENIRKYFK